MRIAPCGGASVLEATDLDTVAFIAEREAAAARGMRHAQMRPLRRHRFDELVSDAAELLRGIPLGPPKDPDRAAAFTDALAAAKPQARRLANRAAEHRTALRSLANRIRGIDDAGWSLDQARVLELEPALLATWIAQGGAAMPCWSATVYCLLEAMQPTRSTDLPPAYLDTAAGRTTSIQASMLP